MTTDQTDGDSQELTVDSAASAFNDIFSREEKDSAPATPQNEANDDDDEEQVVTDEVEGEEPESEEDEEGDEQTPEEEVAPPKVFKVKVDGEEIDVPEDELLKGYSRTADYTRKTQAVAEKDRALEAERVARGEERRQAAELYTRLEEAIASVTPDEPDWDTLRNENPVEFASEWAAWQQFKQRTEAIKAEKQKAIALVQKDQTEAIEKYLDGERVALVEAIPSWKDAAVATAEKDEIATFAKSAGYTDADLAEIRDHRVLVLLRKAMLYDKSQKAKPAVKVKIQAVKTATPGSSATSTRTKSKTESLRQRLRSSGSVQDAAALFSSMD